MELKVIYEDDNLFAIDKPSGITVFSEGNEKEKTLIDYLLEKFPNLKNVGRPPRFGIVHRLDKETSGIILVAKDDKTLEFLQKQFKERKVIKRYLALIVGKVKENQGNIETLIGRSPKNRKKQKVYLPLEPKSKGKRLRKAITEYKILERFKDYTLIEVIPKTGRKHQIRVHFSNLFHPIAGDKLYGFKNQPKPENLDRLFLHAHYLKIKIPAGETIELRSDLTKNLKEILEKLTHDNKN